VQGERLHQGFIELQRKHRAIGDARGLGLMQALELVGEGKTPDARTAAAVLEGTRKRGVLVGKGGLWGNVLRVAPPLVVTASQIDELLAALDGAFTDAAAAAGRA
jgi:4-aminobutyrate aminotransferase-like enzyme